MNNQDFLNHYGVLGMKWGVRRTDRQLRKEAKADADFKRRNKVINKIKSKGEKAEMRLGDTYVLRGEKSANRILDLMSKNPKRSFTSASIQERGEKIARKALVVIGAMAVGTGASLFVQKYK